MSKAFDIGFDKVDKEIALDQLNVQGSIPEWLSGDLLRNGPGTFRVGDDHYKHWFDGLAMQHRFSFSEGKVSYQNKYLDCKAYQAAKNQNSIVYPEFGTEPDDNIFGRIKSFFKPRMTDSAKVSVDKIGERILALNETPMQVEFDPKTLDSKGIFNYEKNPGRHNTTVHPQFYRLLNKSYILTTP